MSHFLHLPPARVGLCFGPQRSSLQRFGPRRFGPHRFGPQRLVQTEHIRGACICRLCVMLAVVLAWCLAFCGHARCGLARFLLPEVHMCGASLRKQEERQGPTAWSCNGRLCRRPVHTTCPDGAPVGSISANAPSPNASVVPGCPVCACCTLLAGRLVALCRLSCLKRTELHSGTSGKLVGLASCSTASADVLMAHAQYPATHRGLAMVEPGQSVA